jgi:hypothetical protein
MVTARAEVATPKEEAQHSGRLLLRLSPALHAELTQAAEHECMSLNAYITRALSESLSEDEPPQVPGGRSRFMRNAVIVDLVMVGVATVTAVALLIVALH